MQPKNLIFFIISLSILLPFGVSDLAADRAALLALRSGVGGRTFLWNVSSSDTCSWAGVRCEQNRVVGLRLPGVAISGQIPTGILGNLTQLKTLSLRLNLLSGELPLDLGNCVNLRNLYLQGNSFSGKVPDFFFSLKDLVRLNLGNNNFSGEISTGFNNLTRLKTLLLQSNQLYGSVPDLRNLQLDQFNVSSNKLNGSIPKGLQKFGSDSFLGNLLCGKPLESACAADSPVHKPVNGTEPLSINPNPTTTKSKKKLSGGAIAGIVIGCVVALFLVLVIVIVFCTKRDSKSSRSFDIASIKQKELEIPGEKPVGEIDNGGYGNGYSVAAAAAAAMVGTGKGEANSSGAKKLVFFGNSGKVFDLEDLLRASAEVLGKGTFGTAYKAMIEGGTAVAVKRLKDVTISEREFREKIEVVGAMDHQNLVPLKAYYFSRDEKLLVYNYMPLGSLSALLHGNTGAGRTPLNWEVRSGIALGAARGLEYLHSQGPGISHGNIKSSNILLSGKHEARVSDFGIAHLVGPSSTPNRVAGYRAPEVTDPCKVSQNADVYSFGVLLLELLTGKPPTHSLLNEQGVDLPRWVQSIVREEWTSEVFDMELVRDQNVEDEMVQLLQLAIDCTGQYPDSRPSISVVASRVEELRRSSLRGGMADAAGPQHDDVVKDGDDPL